MPDHYFTIENEASANYNIKGSKFYSYIYPVQNIDEIKNILSSIKKQHHSANHHVYAYILGINQETEKANDDKEPSNSAGMPVLNQIKTNDLTNTLIIVVRYFGGIKLGIPGLIDAYKTSASYAISNADIIKKTIHTIYQINFDYSEMNFMNKIINDHNFDIIDRSFTDTCSMKIAVPFSLSDALESSLRQNHRIDIEKID